jgi:Fingers domain of DNA polymerase lambda
MGIYGVGRSTAMRFVMQGFRSLQDVLERGKPNESQRIGIELYDVCPLVTVLIGRILQNGFQEKKFKDIPI